MTQNPDSADADWLERSIQVPVTPAIAWTVFVERFASWWPSAYSLSADRLATIGIEPEPGARCFERDLDGRELAWGTVIAADRPDRLTFFWQITADRRIEPDTANASEVDVRFEAEGSGTRVRLTHRGFSRHGGDWRAYRDGMGSEQGWTYCLQRFAEAAGETG